MIDGDILIIHYGEIGLKGKNQVDFLRCLQRNIQSALNRYLKGVSVKMHRGYYSVDIKNPDSETVNAVIGILSATPGISWFAMAKKTDRKSIEESVISVAKDEYVEEGAFVVRVNRSDKSYPKKSNELEKELGSVIINSTSWQNVSLKNADTTIYIDIYKENTCIYTKRYKGAGGIPVGSSEKVLSLLSGGIDSPVASFLIAKRGCGVDFVHFTATPMQHKEAIQYKVCELVKKLSQTTLNSTLYLVPYTHYQLATMENRVDYDLIVFRRFMIRVAETLAKQNNHKALVCGDNLAQVASQTLPNIISADKATDMSILRPLIGYDKNEIIDIAKKIGTYEISIEPYKDCCSIVSQNPKTKSNHNRLSEIESRLFENYQKIIDDSVSDSTVIRYENGLLCE